MGIAILVIIGAVSAVGVFAFLALTRGSRQHPRHIRGVRHHDPAQYGPLRLGSSAGWDGSGWGGGSCDSGSSSSSDSGGGSC